MEIRCILMIIKWYVLSFSHKTCCGCSFESAGATIQMSTNSSFLILGRFSLNLSCIMRKPDLYISKNKDADELRGNRQADQRLCFHYIHRHRDRHRNFIYRRICVTNNLSPVGHFSSTNRCKNNKYHRSMHIKRVLLTDYNTSQKAEIKVH